MDAPQRLKRRLIAPLKMASEFTPSEHMPTEPPHTNTKGAPPIARAGGTVTTTSQLQTNSQTSSTTTRVKSSSSSTTTSTQRLHLSASDLKASNVKSDLVDFKNNLNDMKSSLPSGSYGLRELNELRSSLENLRRHVARHLSLGWRPTTHPNGALKQVDSPDANQYVEGGDAQPLVTYPDDSRAPSEVSSPQPGNALGSLFEQKTTNRKRTKVVKDGVTAEKESANVAESKRLHAGDVTYEENKAAAAIKARVEIDGISAEKSHIKAKEARSLKSGDISQQETKNMAHTNTKLSGDKFSAEKSSTESQQQRQLVTASGMYSDSHAHSHSHSSSYMSGKGISAADTKRFAQVGAQVGAQFHSLLNGSQEDELLATSLDDLEQLSAASQYYEVEKAIKKYTAYLEASVKCIQRPEAAAPQLLSKINDVVRKAWAVPTYGHELGYSLCNALRKCGGLDLLMANCTRQEADVQFNSAKLLEQCLTTENRAHVVEHGLDKVVHVACVCTRQTNSAEHSRVGTGILEHLFKHSEETCSDVVRLGGLDALLFECRKSDVETLRHCAGALANLSLYGGAENQEAMIKRKVPMWLFPLAFHNDDHIKYYACLAITVLVANAEIEADVIQSGTLDLVEPFVTTHNPSEFARSNLAHAHGQSKTWLKHLVPVLSSKREEARNLAAFHFCMEAGIKKQQSNTFIFQEIGAIDALKRVASCPNAVASKYAAQALRLIGEEVPHKLSQQVPLWSAEDVEEWVKQIGFTEVAAGFVESRVDGDLLLQLTEENLRDDIGLTNGIKRKRFTRELQKLKRMADYTSRDSANINNFLQSLGPEFCTYTYSVLNAGVETKDALRNISEDQLLHECGIANSIHRFRIMEGIRQLENRIGSDLNDESPDKSLDVFVSYRRSNGSQLASLLKVHLQLRGFSVFIDVERLEAGKFDNNLLQSIHKAKHFLLVLTPMALERCKHDHEKKDWVHREIVAALSSNCNIIPIIDNFTFPEADELPEDMRQVCHFNAVRWIHDYQDACVDKLERFMRGELNARSSEGNLMRVGLGKGDITPSTPSTAGMGRQPPSYQRMHSNDSGSGKGSDKEPGGGLRD
ncbi:NAD(+) hydrolase sarm1 isoform X2 [Dendroctonus ponderosae]|uniref:NAD(+) hydrolase sarm1 isoform X2 n=1 Tax=Dendroctonus ponderosae TaxID=77166 RepID=UPI0020353FA7|nr:NAD(+) hydrolase sarm1 isoform X2 [Dendroctonus ponderosae]